MQGKNSQELLVVSRVFNEVRLYSIFSPEGQVFKRLISCVELLSAMITLLKKVRLGAKPFKNC